MSFVPAAPPVEGRDGAAEARRWPVAVAGAVALAVAMGIGRFAFTPLLPMMLADGVIDLPTASWLASANYLGYLAGALFCTFQPWLWARAPRWPPIEAPSMIRGGLVATGVLTLGMALPWPAAWPALRFAAGVASALVFVHSSGWCLGELARRGSPALGGAMFVGPGAGIVLSGAFAGAMVAWQWRAATGWAIFGVLAFALSASVWRLYRVGSAGRETASASADPGRPVDAAPRASSALIGVSTDDANRGALDDGAARGPAVDAAHRLSIDGRGASDRSGDDRRPAVLHSRTEVGWLAFAYGLAGFGYIVTATFLPVIARQALPDSGVLDTFWPLFGIGVIGGALLSTRLRVTGDLRRLLAASYGVQAVAIVTSVWSPTPAGFAFGSLLLGFPFTAITYFAMQEVRRLRPAQSASTMGLLTALYGIGQTVGPPLVALLLQRTASAHAGFTVALEIAAAALVVGAAIHFGMSRVYPRAVA